METLIIDSSFLGSGRSKVVSDANAVAEATRRRILDKAGELFFQFGYKRVTMDDIARELGMSKKTIYQHVPSKDALVETFMMGFLEETIEKATATFQGAEDVVELTQRLLPFLRDRFSKISPVMMADLQRYYPHLWEQINQRRMAVLALYMGQLERDRERGLIRPEINPKVMVKIIMTVVQEVANPATFLELQVPLPDVMETVINLIMRGALTSQGRERFEEGL